MRDSSIALGRFLFLLCFTLCFESGLRAQDSTPLYDHLTTGSLSNGLRYVILEDHREPIVALAIRLNVGSKDEDPDQLGFAHFMEHLFFVATPLANEGGIKTLEGLGATDINAVTNQDRTVLFETVPAENLWQVLNFEANRLSHIDQGLSETVLKEQLAIIDREARQKEDSVNGRIAAQLTAHSYPPNHPYSRPVLGDPKVLHGASVDQITNWYTAHYTPASITISIAGDVMPARAITLLADYFGKWEGQPVFASTVHPALSLGRGRVPLPLSGVNGMRILATWNLPPEGSNELISVELLAKCLADGHDSILSKAFTARGIPAEIDESLFRGDLNSQLRISVNVASSGQADLAESLFTSTLSDFLAHGVDAASARRAASEMRFGSATQRDRLSGLGGAADYLATAVSHGVSAERISSEVGRVGADPSELRSVLDRWFTSGPLLLVLNGDARNPPANDVHAAIEQPKALGASARAKEISRFALRNGLKVGLIQRPSFGLIDTTIVVQASSKKESPALSVGKAALYLVSEHAHRALSVPADADPSCDYIEFESDYDGATGTIHFLASKNCLQPALRSVSAAISRLRPSPADIREVKEQENADTRRTLASPARLATLALSRMLYVDSCRALASAYSPADVDQVTSAAIHTFIEQFASANHLSLAVAGEASLPWLKSIVTKSLGGLQLAHATLREAECSPSVSGDAEGRITIIDRPEAKQAMLVAANITPQSTPADFVAESLLAAILGGNKGSRLNLRLREEKQWSYGVHSQMVALKHANLLSTTIPVQIEHIADSIQLVQQEYRSLQSKSLSEDEFRDAKTRFRQEIAAQAATTSGIGDEVAQQMKSGPAQEPSSSYSLEFLDHEDRSALLDRARQFLIPEKTIWFIVGPRESVMEQLHASETLRAWTIFTTTPQDLLAGTSGVLHGVESENH